MLEKITPLILTFNEEANIGRTLAPLAWAKRVVVLDSFSTDKTLEIAKQYPNVEVFQRKFDCHQNQWNYGLDAIQTEWVLSLDADYVVTKGLVNEMEKLTIQADGFFIPFRYCMGGKPLSQTLLPPRLALFRKACGKYIQDGHTQLLELNGSVGRLSEVIYHDDRKSFSRWWAAQKKYTALEAEKLNQTPWSELKAQDKIRKLIFLAPGIVLIYCLFGKGLLLDGGNGIIYSFQRALAELLLSWHLLLGKRS